MSIFELLDIKMSSVSDVWKYSVTQIMGLNCMNNKIFMLLLKTLKDTCFNTTKRNNYK